MGRMGLAWSTAQLIAYRGQPNEAAQVLTEHAELLRAAGIDFWSALALLSGLELAADESKLNLSRELLAGMESEFLNVHLDFLIARQNQDVDGILALVPRLTESGRPGLGVVAHRLAAEWLHSEGAPERARQVELAKESYVAGLSVRTYDATRFFATAINLTEREREISNLVASGLTNPQIAARLVLSVRTVESHLHRIMRKTSVANRSELATLIRSIAA
jgi:DNA-binding CsgD family transcriptional regulator